MKLEKINTGFTVCKLSRTENIDFSKQFVFLAKTDDEISLVCESDYTPPNTIASEPGWKALKIAGTLDFGLIGVIAKISGLLAEAGISIFVVSTYNTDYILLRSSAFDKGIQLLENNGYTVV